MEPPTFVGVDSTGWRALDQTHDGAHQTPGTFQSAGRQRGGCWFYPVGLVAQKCRDLRGYGYPIPDKRRVHSKARAHQRSRCFWCERPRPAQASPSEELTRPTSPAPEPTTSMPWPGLRDLPSCHTVLAICRPRLCPKKIRLVICRRVGIYHGRQSR